MIAIKVNGKTLAFEEPVTVADVLDKFQLAEKLVVVEHNQRIVEREAYVHTPLRADDCLEIVRFVGGG